MIFKKEFSYTGFVQNFTIPKNGFYLFEAWGAQGGNVTSSYWNIGFTGGYGAYSTGSVYLEKDTVIYVAVGQNGAVTEDVYTFNGGGAAHQRTYCYTTTSSGGGATHFSFQNSVLKGLSDVKQSVLLVAAGGGGSYTSMCNLESDSGSFNGGHAGGVVGSSPVYTNQVGYSNTLPTGGTQTRGGISSTNWKGNDVDTTTAAYNGYFGQGGIYSTACGFSGGGGGWYGGASGQWRAGAGGSSYISEHLVDYKRSKKRMVCFDCQTSSMRANYTVNTSHASYLPIKDYAKIGAGYAKVTLLSSFFSCGIKRKTPSFLVTCSILVLIS